MASATKVLLSQTGSTGNGPTVSFQSSDTIRTLQFNPRAGGVGYTGAMLIEGSFAANPGNNDYQTLVALTFTSATESFALDVETTCPWIRVRVTSATSGAISVSGSSRTGTIAGSQGSLPANVVIDSQLLAAGTGSGFIINSPVVPSITSDDVFMATNLSQSVTAALAAKQPLIGSGEITASEEDLNLLSGKANAGLEAADFTKLASVTASASEINKLTGLTTTAAELTKLHGVTAVTADFNAIAGLNAAGVGPTQLAYLAGLSQNVQTSLNSLPNLVGLNSSVNDLNLLRGASAGTNSFSGAAITSTVLSYLSGVSSNIQTQLNGKRSTSATIGISEITSAAISITELNYLSGVTSNIQTQLNNLAFSGTYGAGQFSGVVKFANGTVSAPGTGFAGAATTGFFLNGSALGVAIAGTQFVNMNGTAVVIGDNTSNGQPYLRGTGYGVTNPAYSFLGDTDTGLYWVSANKLGVAASGRVLATIDGNTTPGAIALGTATDNTAVSIPGIFAGEKLLGTATVAAGKNPAITVGSGHETDIYTVPTGRTCIVTRVAVIITTATQGGSGGSVSQFRMDLGNKAGTVKELLDNVTNTTVFNPGGSYSFSTAGQVMWLGTGDNPWHSIAGSNGNAYAVFGAGTVLSARPQARADFDVWTVSVALFGYEY